MRRRTLFCLAAFVAAAALGAQEVEGGRLECEASLCLGYPDGVAIGSGLRYRWPGGLVLGLGTRIPASALSLAFPMSDEGDGARTTGFRVLDLEWGLVAGWEPEISRVLRGSVGLGFGGLTSYRGGHYEDDIAGLSLDYSKWTWLKELRLEAAISASVGEALGLPALDGLRLRLRGGIPLRQLTYAVLRWSAGLDLAWTRER